jgi:DNA invertase Pin-like site-specific DNA recombinase
VELRLQNIGCIVVRTEKLSGSSRNGGDGLVNVLVSLQSGYVLVVFELDRLGRNIKDVLNLVHERRGDALSVRASDHMPLLLIKLAS